MRKNNWTMIAVAALIAGLLYYYYQESNCVRGKRASEVSTSMDTEGDQVDSDVTQDLDEDEALWMDEDESDADSGSNDSAAE